MGSGPSMQSLLQDAHAVIPLDPACNWPSASYRNVIVPLVASARQGSARGCP